MNSFTLELTDSTISELLRFATRNNRSTPQHDVPEFVNSPTNQNTIYDTFYHFMCTVVNTWSYCIVRRLSQEESMQYIVLEAAKIVGITSPSNKLNIPLLVNAIRILNTNSTTSSENIHPESSSNTSSENIHPESSSNTSSENIHPESSSNTSSTSSSSNTENIPIHTDEIISNINPKEQPLNSTTYQSRDAVREDIMRTANILFGNTNDPDMNRVFQTTTDILNLLLTPPTSNSSVTQPPNEPVE